MPRRKKNVAKKLSPGKAKEVASENIFEEKVRGVHRPNVLQKGVILSAALGVALLALGYFFRSLFVVALVNGQPITRLAVVNGLEKQQGKQALDNLITEAVILQEAKKQGVATSQDEINEEISKIEEQITNQGMQLDEALAAGGMTRDDLIRKITIQKSLEKLLADKIKVSDQEVDDYLIANAASFAQDQLKEENKDSLRQSVKDQLSRQKLSTAFQDWTTDVRSKAKILYFKTY